MLVVSTEFSLSLHTGECSIFPVVYCLSISATIDVSVVFFPSMLCHAFYNLLP